MYLMSVQRALHQLSSMQRCILQLSMGMLMGHAIAHFMHVCLVSEQTKTTNMQSNVSLYIGILSARKYLFSRATTSLETWGKNSSVTLEVFADMRNEEDPGGGYHFHTLSSGHKVVSLPGVKDDVYPPQKKSFSAIKYMHDFHLDKFDWFMRLDDDAYVKVDKLKKFLNRINASEPWYIGQPAFGTDKGDRVSKGENYCMGGPGSIFSRGLLRKLGPHLKHCLGQLETEHEDVELGRCVTKIAGIKCTMAREADYLFHQHFEKTGHMPDIKVISEEVLDEAITFHANKHTEPQQNLHSKVLARKLHERISRIVELQLDRNPKKQLWRESRQEHLMLFSGNGKSYKTADGEPVVSESEAGKAVYQKVKLRMLRKAKSLAPDELKMICLKPAGYHTEKPLVNLNARVEITCQKASVLKFIKSDSPKVTVQFATRRKLSSDAIFWQETRNLTFEIETMIKRRKCEAKQNSNSNLACEYSKNVPVNFLLSLSGRQNTFERFLHSFEKAFLSTEENINLIVAYFSPEIEENKKFEDSYLTEINLSLKLLQLQYPNSDFELVEMKKGEAFSRGRGLHECAKHVKANHILFFCDVDLVFTPELLMHIRRSTLRGKQVYYPAFFSEYDPKVVDHKSTPEDGLYHFQERNGFWRDFSYGMVSMYSNDYFRTGGFDLKIKGWGLEDYRLLDSILRTGFQVFRANDPGQVHVFHEKFCDKKLSRDQLSSCRRSRASHYGSKNTMYKLWRQRL